MKQVRAPGRPKPYLIPSGDRARHAASEGQT
jgi:hypothetical protein